MRETEREGWRKGKTNRKCKVNRNKTDRKGNVTVNTHNARV